jgi:transposase-like protein
MAGEKGMRRYSLETKVEAVKMFFEEGYRKRDILAALGIKNDTQLEEWFRRFRSEGYDGLKHRQKGPKSRRQDDVTALERIEQLEMKVELLEAFLLVEERK